MAELTKYDKPIKISGFINIWRAKKYTQDFGNDWRIAMEIVPLEWPVLLAILSKGFVLIEAAKAFH